MCCEALSLVGMEACLHAFSCDQAIKCGNLFLNFLVCAFERVCEAFLWSVCVVLKVNVEVNV